MKQQRLIDVNGPELERFTVTIGGHRYIPWLSLAEVPEASHQLDMDQWPVCEFCCTPIYVKRIQYLRPITQSLTLEQELRDKLLDLNGEIYVEIKKKFCIYCGRPLTRDAQAQMQHRLGGNYETD